MKKIYIILLVYFISISIIFLSFEEKALALLLSLLSFFLIFEIILRFVDAKKNIIKNVSNISELYIMSHPNLPYAYFPNTLIMNNNKPNFPIKNFDYLYPKLEINSKGHVQLMSAKKATGNKNDVIGFIGDSVIGSYLEFNEKVYQIPHLVRLELAKENIDISTLDFSTGGYTIQDILVKFILKDVFDNVSITVINCGYASVRSFFYKNYTTDNVHFRNNFDKLYFLIALRGYLPDFGLYAMKYIYQLFLPSNTRSDLLKYVSKDGFHICNDPTKGITAFFEHYRNLLDIIRSKGIIVIMTTIPHYQYKITEGHDAFSKIISQINNKIRIMACENKIELVDLEKIVKKESKYFVDEAHFSHEGMLVASETIAKKIKKLLIKDESS